VRSARRPAAAVLAVAGILLGAGTAGFVLERLIASQKPTLRYAPAPSVPAPAAAARDLTPERRAIPDQLPDFSLPDLEGTPHRLKDWQGRALAVNFWATWCEPCRREIPLLQTIGQEKSANGLKIVGIAIDHPDNVRKFVHELGIGYPILVGEQGGLEAVAAFGMDTVLPFTVFADTKGRVVTLKVGELHRDEATFILARLTDLDAGRLSLAAAREQIGEGVRRLAAARAQGAGGKGSD